MRYFSSDVKANGGVLDEISSRKASYSLPRHGKGAANVKQGIDNPALDMDIKKEPAPKHGYKSREDIKF